MSGDTDSTAASSTAASGRPELLVAGAFAGGLLVAIVLRQVAPGG